ncbi:hypothetical protein CK203_018175 [Vitis vinifera]|uniref:Reverse transcriptase domain-containing protein n=1 Tax=Vitis vinifera TaxID=29760 RepID=A0A438JPF4_VITVI|nr:hypothetical protein CK203_018175 [Vitis vinifera]
MIRSQKVDLFCIQETKIQSMTEGLVRSLGSGRFLDWGAMGAQGAARGILIFGIKEPWRFLRWRWGSSQFLGRLKCYPLPKGNEQSGKADWRNEKICSGGGFRRGPSPFRFENMWLKVDGLKIFFGVGGERRASFRLATKMKVLKEKIKGWNRDVFGRLEVIKTQPFNKSNFGMGWRVKGVYRRQVSRELWLKEGTRTQGSFTGWPMPIEETTPWKKLRSMGVGWRRSRSLSHNEAEVLEQPFTEEEIHSALMEMNGDKAPGPDGFTVAFWQSCWDFVKEEIVDLFKEFFDKKSFAKSLNTTFLVLIPKKVLANRLKKVLDKVVSADQNAFVRRRQILDASLIANEGAALRRFPLSLPFVLGMEVLSVLLRRAIDGGFISGCSLRGREGMQMNVSHLLFVDGTIIFCEASEVIPVGEVEDIDELVVELGCRVGSLPTVYLGLPLGANHKASSMWDGVEERMRRRLTKCLEWGLEGDFEGDELVLDNIGYLPWRSKRNVTVNEMWDSSLGQGGWNIRFSRDSNDWKLDAIGELFHMLRDLRISSEEDSVIWKGGGHGSFQIRDAYKLLAAPSAITFPKKEHLGG